MRDRTRTRAITACLLLALSALHCGGESAADNLDTGATDSGPSAPDSGSDLPDAGVADSGNDASQPPDGGGQDGGGQDGGGQDGGGQDGGGQDGGFVPNPAISYGAECGVGAPSLSTTCGDDGNVYFMDCDGNVGELADKCMGSRESAKCKDGPYGAACRSPLADRYICNSTRWPENGRVEKFAITRYSERKAIQSYTGAPCTPGLGCFQDDEDRHECRSSVADPNSPYYLEGCYLQQFLRNPTVMPADCRCLGNTVSKDYSPWEVCQGVFGKLTSGDNDRRELNIGEGPRPAIIDRRGGVDHDDYGGFIDESRDQLVWAGKLSSSITQRHGFVFAMNYETGDRHVVSGEWQDLPDDGFDPLTAPNVDPDQRAACRPNRGCGWLKIGQGPFMREVWSAKMGPDGKYYVQSFTHPKTINGQVRRDLSEAALQIFRVDPDTGDREIIYEGSDRALAGEVSKADGTPYPQCPRGREHLPGSKRFQFQKGSFEIGPDGSFYLSSLNGGHGGVSVVRFDKDFTACEFITRDASRQNDLRFDDCPAGGPANCNIGVGDTYNQFPYTELLYHETPGGDDVLFATNGEDLVEIVMEGAQKGNRYKVVSGVPTSYNQMSWDRHRNGIILSGSLGADSHLFFIDPVAVQGFSIMSAFGGCDDPSLPTWISDSCIKGPVTKNGFGLGKSPVAAHPDGIHYVGVTAGGRAVDLMHLADGNSNTISF